MAVVTGAWFPVCRLDELPPERGVTASVGGRGVVVFRTRDDRLYALVDGVPSARADGLASGRVGSWGGVPTLTSPTGRHVFDLRTGACLDDPRCRVPVVPLRVVDGAVEVPL